MITDKNLRLQIKKDDTRVRQTQSMNMNLATSTIMFRL